MMNMESYSNMEISSTDEDSVSLGGTMANVPREHEVTSTATSRDQFPLLAAPTTATGDPLIGAMSAALQ